METPLIIRYCGNFDHPYCTESHLASTLEKMGHTVIRLQEDTCRPEDIVGECDLFLFTRTWGNKVKQEHLDAYKSMGIPTASYHLDLYVGLQRDGGINTDPFWRTDYVFTPDGDPHSAEVFRSKGINHHYLKPGVFEEECYIAEPTPQRHEVIFVGSYDYHPEYPYRHQLIDWLKANYPGFELWGAHGLGHIRGHELNQLYASTKIVIGDSLILPGHTHYWSDRAYETLGRGGFLIHPFIPGMEEEFKTGEHLVYYEHGNFDELRFTIDYYLSHDAQRETIRKQGHEFVKNNCTYTQRLTQVLDIIGLTREKKINPERGED